MHELYDIKLGRDICTIGVYAFEDCIKLSDVVFTGDAPSLNNLGIYHDATLFNDLEIRAEYPRNNITWTEEVRKSYGKNVRWSDYIPEI